MEILGIIADVLVILFFATVLVCFPIIWKRAKRAFEKRNENKLSRLQIQNKELLEEREKSKIREEKLNRMLAESKQRNKALEIKIKEKDVLIEELKEESDSYWRQLSGFLQRHPDEVETIDEDEINNPDDYKYVAR